MTGTSTSNSIEELMSGKWTISQRGFVAGIGASGVGMLLAPKLIDAQRRIATAIPATDAILPDDAAAWSKYNLNTITADQILSIPGAGDRMTREFDEYRPWTTIGQFRAEIGKYMDSDVADAYLRYLFVPIAVNDAGSHLRERRAYSQQHTTRRGPDRANQRRNHPSLGASTPQGATPITETIHGRRSSTPPGQRPPS